MRNAFAVMLPALLALAGCARVPVVSYNMAVPAPTQDTIAYLTNGRVNPVVVLSSPFPGTAPYQLAQLVAPEMPRLNNASFAAAPDINVPADYVLVWRFSGRTGTAGSDVTADLALISPGDSPLSQAMGHVDGIAGPDDPAFKSLIEQLTFTVLWPSSGPEAAGGNLRVFLFR